MNDHDLLIRIDERVEQIEKDLSNHRTAGLIS